MHRCVDAKQVVVSTEQGDLYLFENMEFRCVIPSAQTDGSAICILAAFSKGFVTGGANGVLKVFERSDDPREFFKCLKVRRSYLLTIIIALRTFVCLEFKADPCRKLLMLNIWNRQSHQFYTRLMILVGF